MKVDHFQQCLIGISGNYDDLWCTGKELLTKNSFGYLYQNLLDMCDNFSFGTTEAMV